MKRDMYIDYSRSYRRRGRKGNGKLLRILLVVLLAVGLGLGSFYAIKRQIELKEPGTKASQDYGRNEGESTEGTDTASNTDRTATKENGQTVGIVVNTAEAADTAGDIPASVDTTGTGAASESTSSADGAAVTQNNAANGQETASPAGSTAVVTDTRIPVKVKGIYVTSKAAGAGLRDDLIEIADTTEINALVIDVKDDYGKITYSMDSKLAKEINSVTNTIPDMESLIKILKEKDIYVIARIVAFKDPFLAEQRKDLALKKKDGSLFKDKNGEYWVNPYNHEVWDYLVDVAAQAAATGFDEIQFDYIRFSTGKGMDKVDFGEESATKTKEDIIIEFTKYAYEKLKPLGVFVAADVYGTIISSSIDAGLVGQNYVEMAKYLDYICPMIYPSHFGDGNYGIEYPDLEPFNIVRKVLTASKEKLDQLPEDEHRAVVRPWLQDFTATWLDHYMKYGGEELREQVKGVYGAGYDEWILWDAGCDYSVDGLLKE